ncbi:hypothetical protein ACFV5J_37945 [Streptomyces zaomyceticus]|uniref:hypothetical protein n=1 Tax=Streptomyces zaomyceticus TaxID=68286 RepID=UPI00364BAEFB
MTIESNDDLGRILAACGGVFGVRIECSGHDHRRLPPRWEVFGALNCITGAAVIMYAPRSH